MYLCCIYIKVLACALFSVFFTFNTILYILLSFPFTPWV